MAHIADAPAKDAPIEVAPHLTLRQRLDLQFDQMVMTRQPLMSDWKDCAAFIDPFSLDALSGEPRKGKPRTGKILDSTAGQAVVTARAGMLAGLFSPSKPWMTVTTKDPRLARQEDVARWLDEYTRVILATLGQSNFYDQLEIAFGDELVFGTCAMLLLEDAEKFLYCETFPIGSYVLGQDSKGRVNAFGREYRISLRQVVNEFGSENLSIDSISKLKQGLTEDEIVLRHLISPNDEIALPGYSSASLPWKECYWERAGGQTAGKPLQPTWGGSTVGRADGPLLRQRGYREFPVAVSRWDRHGGTIWATRWPAALSIGDIKQLQAMERSSLNAANKGIEPALVGGPSTQNTDVSTMSGEVTSVMETGDGMLKPIHVPDPRWMQFLEAKEEQARQRIKGAFFEPVFQAVMQDQRATRATATEIEKLDREIMAILGPLLERHNALADIVIERTSNILVRRSIPFWQQGEDGVLPRPPASMEDSEVDLEVRYVSDVALSQKRNGLASMERFGQTFLALAQAFPASADGVDIDAFLNEVADRSGMPEKVTRPDEERDAIRQARAEAQQQQRLAENIPPMAGAAKDLSETQVNGRSALDQLIGSPQ